MYEKKVLCKSHFDYLILFYSEMGFYVVLEMQKHHFKIWFSPNGALFSYAMGVVPRGIGRIMQCRNLLPSNKVLCPSCPFSLFLITIICAKSKQLQWAPSCVYSVLPYYVLNAVKHCLTKIFVPIDLEWRSSCRAQQLIHYIWTMQCCLPCHSHTSK